MKFSDRVVEILSGCPKGLTSDEIAERLGITPRNISSQLGKLAAYGIIKRRWPQPVPNARRNAIYEVVSAKLSPEARASK